MKLTVALTTRRSFPILMASSNDISPLIFALTLTVTLSQLILPALQVFQLLAIDMVSCTTATTNTDIINNYDNKTFHVGVLLPLHGKKSVGQEAITAINVALDWANTDPSLTYLRAGGYTFDIKIHDTNCDTGKGLFEVVNMVTGLANDGHLLDAFIGEIFCFC